MENIFEIEYQDSAFKHGIKKEDISFAMRKPLYEDLFSDFPEKFLAIGFDTNRNLLEIIYKEQKDGTLSVFHAMKCRKKYISMLKTFKSGGEI